MLIATIWGSRAEAGTPAHIRGVCVHYAALPLIDAYTRYVAKIYAPPCQAGDTFVPVR